MAINMRSKVPYQTGLGPHTEAATVSMVMNELAATTPDTYAAHKVGVPYADGSRQKCDLCLGKPPSWEWAIEVKNQVAYSRDLMAAGFGDRTFGTGCGLQRSEPRWARQAASTT